MRAARRYRLVERFWIEHAEVGQGVHLGAPAGFTSP
jgi:hypothetical protein